MELKESASSPLILVGGLLCAGFIISLFFPAVFSVAWLLSSGLLHELGHCYFFWLSGVFAVPVLFFFALPVMEFNWFFWGSFNAVFLLALWWGLQRRWIELSVFAGATIALSTIFTFLLSEGTVDQFVRIGGGVGEFLFAIIFIYLFSRTKHLSSFWLERRIIFLVVACFALSFSSVRWFGVVWDMQSLPTGSMIFGAHDQNGDINVLMQTHGWGEGDVRFWMGATMICAWLALIALFSRDTLARLLSRRS